MAVHVVDDVQEAERALILALRAPDEGALDAFHDLVGAGLRHYLETRFGRLGVSVEDVYAETLAKACLSLERYDPGTSRFRTWVYTIARNAAVDHLRKDAAARAMLELELRRFARGHEAFGAHEAQVAAARAQTRLAPLEEQVVAADLRGFPDQDDARLARELGTSVASVHAQRAKAYRKLGLRPLKRRDALDWIAREGPTLARRLGWRGSRGEEEGS